MKFLINSINTMNLINGVGVPIGTRCASILFVNVFHPYNKNPIHNGNEIIMFKLICLLGVNKLGFRPRILDIKKKTNKDGKIRFLPSFVCFRAILNKVII